MSIPVTSQVNYLLTILNSSNPIISDYPCYVSDSWLYTTFSELSNTFPHYFSSGLSRCHLSIHLRNLLPVNLSSNWISALQTHLFRPNNSSKSCCFSSLLQQPHAATEDHYTDSSYYREQSNENSKNNVGTHFMEIGASNRSFEWKISPGHLIWSQIATANWFPLLNAYEAGPSQLWIPAPRPAGRWCKKAGRSGKEC